METCNVDAPDIRYKHNMSIGSIISFLIFRTSIIITFIGEGTSIFSGFVVFTVLGFMAHELNVPVEEVVKSGTDT